MSRHPLHPALVHFPIACWSLAVTTDVSGLWLGDLAWRWSSGLFAVGCITALVAMLAGLIELSRVPDGIAMRIAYWHMGAMLLASIFFSVRLFLRLEDMHALEPNVISLLLDAAGFACLILGGWLGGTLVYQHGVGRSNH